MSSFSWRPPTNSAHKGDAHPARTRRSCGSSARASDRLARRGADLRGCRIQQIARECFMADGFDPNSLGNNLPEIDMYLEMWRASPDGKAHLQRARDSRVD